MRSLFAFLMLVFAGLCISGQAHAQGGACAPYVREAARAMKTGDMETAATALQKARAAHACSGGQLARMGRMAAFAAMRAAWKPGIAPSAREALLREGLKLGRPWQLLAALGDILKARKQYGAAARLYQEALDDIANREFNPRPPRPGVIRGIYRKAEICRQLAKTYVATTRGRSGEPGGLGRGAWRGFTVRKAAVPIEFKTGGTAFTEKGAKAVADMLDILNRKGAPDIVLTGHTDERGGRAYNQKLSLARARAVRDWLKAKGYAGKIRAEGRGEDEPFELDDPSGYSREEIWQINRRVEMRISPREQ